MTNPIGVAGTRRQRVTTREGVTLERQLIYLPLNAWQALQRLSSASRNSGSQIIEQLIQNADRGNPAKETQNDRTSTNCQAND